MSGICDSNIASLQKQNEELKQFLEVNGSSTDITEENIDLVVYPKEVFSDAIIDLTAKENSIEDCLVALQKIYEKEVISLDEFLK